MIVIPAIIGLIMVGGTMFAVMEIMGTHDQNEKSFYDSKQKTDMLIHNWSRSININQMKVDLDSFNEKHRDKKISLFIYEGKKLVYPLSTIKSTPIWDAAISQNGSHTFFMDNIAIYKENVGKYSIILEDTNFSSRNKQDGGAYDKVVFNLVVIMSLLIIAIILLTNRFLTRFVFKSIIVPLDTLVYGVRQIRDGNLD